MSRFSMFSILACSLAIAACDGGGDFSVLGIAALATGAPEPCTFDANVAPEDQVVLDTAASFALHLPLVVENETGSGLTAERFDLSFECIVNGFQPDLAPLSLPEFSRYMPFCKTRKDDDDQTPFHGFDIVPATSARIDAGARGVAKFDVITHELGEAIDRAIRRGSLADACLRASPGQFIEETATPCQELKALNVMSVPEDGSSLDRDDLENVRAYAVFDGEYADQLAAQGGTTDFPHFGAEYTMQIRGILMAVGDDGGELESNEVLTTLRFCRHCGVRENDQRKTRDEFSCYY